MFRQTVLLATALALAACNPANQFVPPTTPANVATDIALLQTDATTVVNGLVAILPTVAAFASNPKYAAAVAKIQSDLASAQSKLPAIAGFSNIAAATSTSQEITTALADALKLAALLPIPQPYAGAIAAANVLLPLVYQEAGLPQPASAAAPLAAGGYIPVKITPAQARARLQLAASTGR